jgi:hypothetical protein
MWEAIKELATITCLLYLIGAGLMGICIYLLIIARLIDVIRHPDAYEEDDEQN